MIKRIPINFILIFAVMLFTVIEVFILNKYSTMGDKLTGIKDTISQIEKQNDSMSQKIASLSAMATISAKAKEYGLVSSSKILSLSTSLPLAANLRLSY